MTAQAARRFRLLSGTRENLKACPQCQKKRFRPYLDELTGEVLEAYGVCNRADSCGFSEFPHELLKDAKGERGELYGGKPLPSPLVRRVTAKNKREQREYLPASLVSELDGRSPLTDFFQERFGREALLEVLRRFPTGTAVKGGKVFSVHWHLDERGRVHTGKMMRYEKRENEVGRAVLKRLKGKGDTNWIHALLDPPFSPENWTQTLFGVTQLKERPFDPVAVCEGYRTAMTASLYFPAYVWTAVDSKDTLTAYEGSCSVLAPLKGREVVLFPDLGKGLEDWKRKEEALKSSGFLVTTDTRLEELATPEEREEGLDLEDFLLRFNPDELS
jgi:hypothetical protein